LEDCGTIFSQWAVTTCREMMVFGALTECNLGPRATRGCLARYRLQIAMATTVMLGGCFGGRGSLDGKVIDVANGGAPVPGAILVLTRSRPANSVTDATSCGGQQLTYSDQQGRFHFDRWSPPIHSVWDIIFPSNYFMKVFAYKRGGASADLRISDKYRGVIQISSQNATPDVLLAEIREAGFHIDCNSRYSDTVKPLIDALKAEAAEVATTPKELQDAVGIFSLLSTYSRHERESARTIIHSSPTPSQSGAAPDH
jgi:hypothetical protein